MIQKILAYLPRYWTEFGTLIIRPKRFIAERNADTEESSQQALIFLGISLVLVCTMTALMNPPGTSLIFHIMRESIATVLFVSLTAVALRAAWHLAGGKSPMRSFIATYGYFAGGLSVIAAVFALIGFGGLTLFAPEFYTKMILSGQGDKMAKAALDPKTQSVVMVVSAIYVVGWGLLIAWFIAAWGAFRVLNDVGKTRSFFAILIGVVITCMLIPVVSFLYAVTSKIF